MSAISEVNNFLSRNCWTLIKRSKVKSKYIKLVHVKWVFDIKEDPDGLIHLKLINVVKGYMQVSGVDYTESFSPVATDTSTKILIGIILYHEKKDGLLRYVTWKRNFYTLICQ